MEIEAILKKLNISDSLLHCPRGDTYVVDGILHLSDINNSCVLTAHSNRKGQVVVKTNLNPCIESKKRLAKEYATLVYLGEDLTVRTHNPIVRDEHYYIVQDFVPEDTIDYFGRISAHNQIRSFFPNLIINSDPTDLFLLDFVKKAALSVTNTHKKGVLNRDIKPGNFLVYPNGRVILIDFGYAKHTGRELYCEEDIENLPGTLDFMAPEIFLHGVYSESSEAYAFGQTTLRAIALMDSRVYLEATDKRKIWDCGNKFEEYIKDKNRANIRTVEKVFSKNKIVRKITDIVSRCIDADIENRPRFSQINYELENISNNKEGILGYISDLF